MATVNNALVTYTNLTTMGLNAIGTPATGNRIATKAFIVANYNVDLASLDNYVNLECPPYQYIIPPCYVVQGYVDGADLNASYNFEVCFDWYNCSGVLSSYCTIAEGGFTLPSDCYNPAYGAPTAYYYEFPGGPKVTACCSYIDGTNLCGSGGTTTTTTTQVQTPCGTPTSFTGGVSYPTPRTITVGSGTGNITLNFDASIVPDRFIVQWNGNYVIDTGYRGDRSYNRGGADRGAFNSSLTGKVDPITGLTYPNTAQWPGDGYPIVISPGSGSAKFPKVASSPSTANVFVYAPMAGTAWSFTLGCPV
jgi:hypothetical protein